MEDSASQPETSSESAPAESGRGDRLLLAAFWVWAALLLVATIAQLAGWQGVLDVLDVKRWFAR